MVNKLSGVSEEQTNQFLSGQVSIKELEISIDKASLPKGSSLLKNSDGTLKGIQLEDGRIVSPQELKNLQEQRALAQELGVGEMFDTEIRQPLGASSVLDKNTQDLRSAQEAADIKRIAELQQAIANYDGNLGKLASIGVGMSVMPDTIDKFAGRHEYTKEDAEAYLEELNKKYPIQQVLGEYYGNILRGESKHIFQLSFVGNNSLENSFYDMVQQSVKAGKWVSTLTKRWGIDYVRKHSDGDEKLALILEYDTLGFFDAYPEAHTFLEDYEREMDSINPLNMLKRTGRLLQMNFEMGKMMREMDDFSRGVLQNKIAKIDARETSYSPFDLQTGVFPKEHFILWLMKRLGTSI